MKADLHASQVRASSLDARVHALEPARAYQVYPPPSMEYGPQYGYAPMRAAPTSRAGKRVHDGELEGSIMVSQPGTHMPMAAAVAPSSHVTPKPSGSPHTVPRGVATRLETAHATTYPCRVERLVAYGGGDAHLRSGVE